MRYKLTIAYDGTHYCGWQVQANGLSIQGLVQQALETFLRHPVDLTGSGRTDAGVHALAQTAHFDTAVPIALPRILLSLNALLPPAIRVLAIEEVSPEFHARYSATGKIYHYYLHLHGPMHPMVRLYRTPIHGSFDRAALQAAIPHFLGKRDFYSFANHREGGVAAYDSIRTLKRLDVVEEEGGLRLEFEGDGFLYKMVRNITGTLLECAAKKREARDIPQIFEQRDRRLAGQAAPPKGLFLVQVCYELDTSSCTQESSKHDHHVVSAQEMNALQSLLP